MKISVCIATYNGEKYIKDQLDSILCQIGNEDEIIISDDGSTDDTQNIILSYGDPRIKLFKHKTTVSNKNQPTIYRVTKNFENALQNASGDIIFLSDQDDVWERTKVQEIRKIFEVQKANLVIHDAMLINEQHKLIGDSYFQLLNSRTGLAKNIFKNSYLGCCMAFDKTVLKSALPFPKNLIAHDMWLGLIAERIGQVAFTDQKLIKYQRHESTVTTSGNKSKNSIMFKIGYRVQFILQYLKRIILLKFGTGKIIGI